MHEPQEQRKPRCGSTLFVAQAALGLGWRTRRQTLRGAIEQVRQEAKRRRETTPSDVAAEAFDYAAGVMERELNEALRAWTSLPLRPSVSVLRCPVGRVTLSSTNDAPVAEHDGEVLGVHP